MMTDIFSSFDPHTLTLFLLSPSLFWSLSFLTLSLVFASFWMSHSQIGLLVSYPLEVINSQLSRTFVLNLKGLQVLITSLFILIILFNFMGLLPYVFSASGHLIMTLTFGLPLWLSLIMSGVTHAPKSTLAGLLPGGAPDWLNPALVLIETTSIFVRFITLSFRLAANITAGHVVLGLIGIYASAALFSSIPYSLSLLFVQSFFILFELGVALIQAYIFCLLLSLYSEDHPHE